MSTIHVEEVSLLIAFVYEKIRNAVEYREDHVIRRAAAERMLTHRLVRGVDSARIARPLVLDLVCAWYLPNDTLPESTIDDVLLILDRYIALWNAAPERIQRQEPLFRGMQGMAAREIEETLIPYLLLYPRFPHRSAIENPALPFR